MSQMDKPDKSPTEDSMVEQCGRATEEAMAASIKTYDIIVNYGTVERYDGRPTTYIVDVPNAKIIQTKPPPWYQRLKYRYWYEAKDRLAHAWAALRDRGDYCL